MIVNAQTVLRDESVLTEKLHAKNARKANTRTRWLDPTIKWQNALRVPQDITERMLVYLCVLISVRPAKRVTLVNIPQQKVWPIGLDAMHVHPVHIQTRKATNGPLFLLVSTVVV